MNQKSSPTRHGLLFRPIHFDALRVSGLVLITPWLLCLASGTSAAPGDLLYKLRDPNPTIYQQFGSRLATVDNFVVIGATGDSTLQPYSGAVSVFEVFTGQRLVALYSPLAEAGGGFGGNIAVRAQDGLLTAAVTAPYEGLSGGRAYSMTAGIATRTVRGFFRPPGVFGPFGSSIAIAGTIIAIGAPLNPGPVDDAPGTVFIFDSATGGLIGEIQNPRPQDPASKEFGSTLAAVGENLLIGTRKKGTTSDLPGYVYLYTSDGEPLHEFVIPPPYSLEYDVTYPVAAIGRNAVIGVPGLEADASRVHMFDADPDSPGFGSLLLTLKSDTPTFGRVLATANNQIIVGGTTVRVYDGTLRGETSEPILTIDKPSGGFLPFWGENVGGLANGNILVADASDSEREYNAGAVYVYEGLASQAVQTRRRFYLDSDFSDLSFTVEGFKGLKMEFKPKIAGILDATFFESDGKVQALKLNTVDIRTDDFHTTQPFRIDLTNARTVLAPDQGVTGAAAPLQDSNFNLLGNEFVVEGQAEVQIGKNVFSMQGGPEAGTLPADIAGYLDKLQLTPGGIGGEGRTAFELNISVEYKRTVAWSEGPFQPVIVSRGRLVGREVPLNPVIPYLLGRGKDTGDLDLNGDGIIDVADALWYIIPQ